MQNVVNINNVCSLEFSVVVNLLHEIYCKEVPEIDTTHPANLPKLEQLMIFFSNQYAYMAELWGTVLHYVRSLKRTGGDKDSIDDNMAKRDYLEKVMSATKLKYYACSRLLMYHAKQGGGSDSI